MLGEIGFRRTPLPNLSVIRNPGVGWGAAEEGEGEQFLAE